MCCGGLLLAALPILVIGQDDLKKEIACKGDSDNTVGCFTPPKPIHIRQITYPPKELETRQEGVVTLEVVVGSNGRPRHISVLQSLGSNFDKVAIDGVKHWKFTPATKDGKPVTDKVLVEIGFHLPH